MGNLKTLIASAFIGISPLNANSNPLPQKDVPSPSSQTEAKKDTINDAYAKYRTAEQHALPLLIFFEGCSLKAYKDSNGIPTIGIGNITFPNGRPVTIKDNLKNNQEMSKMVVAYLEKHTYPVIDKYITRELEPEEMAALLSLTYNCNASILQTNGRPSQIARLINNGGSVENLSRAFLRKAYSRSGFNNGLAVRRTMEVLYAQKRLTYEDFQNFYVCSYDKLNYKDLTVYLRSATFTGRLVKTDDQTAEMIRNICNAEPDAATRKKREWFGGDRQVKEFIPINQRTPLPKINLTPILFAESSIVR